MNEEWEKMENLSDENININDDMCITELEKIAENTVDLTATVQEIENNKENENGNE